MNRRFKVGMWVNIGCVVLNLVFLVVNLLTCHWASAIGDTGFVVGNGVMAWACYVFGKTQGDILNPYLENHMLRQACRGIPETLLQSADIIESELGDPDQECAKVRFMANTLKTALEGQSLKG